MTAGRDVETAISREGENVAILEGGDAVEDPLPCARHGLLSGGYGADALPRSGAIRVYDDPADLLPKIDDVEPVADGHGQLGAL